MTLNRAVSHGNKCCPYTLPCSVVVYVAGELIKYDIIRGSILCGHEILQHVTKMFRCLSTPNQSAPRQKQSVSAPRLISMEKSEYIPQIHVK